MLFFLPIFQLHQIENIFFYTNWNQAWIPTCYVNSQDGSALLSHKYRHKHVDIVNVKNIGY